MLWAEDTAREQLSALGVGSPHATTLGRIFERLDAGLLDRLAGAWVQAAIGVSAISVEGKEVRGAKNGGGSRVHLMAAIDHGTGAVLGQVSVAEKSNEIPSFSTLLDGITDLTGSGRMTLDHAATYRDMPIWRSSGSAARLPPGVPDALKHQGLQDSYVSPVSGTRAWRRLRKRIDCASTVTVCW
ncbi:hypothetical protein IV500_14870 [Paeniglutamicibacter antarcticus]|uniref:Transposase n=1 Tax=Arthrobacter terrae TaxID=2935737 RepID=A0A931CQR0_9MICC|nr:hypothetical protein [Arthrobacter terrae]MBG0740660.1 hypothetical protein [Arthrobacter terrae]